MPKKQKSIKELMKAYKTAYENIDFLESPDARNIRVLSEFMEPHVRLRKNNISGAIVFFGSARTLPENQAKEALREKQRKIKRYKNPPKKMLKEYLEAKNMLKVSKYYTDAEKLAEKLTKWARTISQKDRRFVICSGGGPGIMEAANKGAAKAKGESIGLNIGLPFEQLPNQFQSKNLSFMFHYFFIRKFWFSYLARALVVFPGGFGTLDELFELLTLAQTHKAHRKIPTILYGKEYWNKIVNFKMLVEWGMIQEQDLKFFRIFDNVEETFKYLTRRLKASKKSLINEDPLTD